MGIINNHRYRKSKAYAELDTRLAAERREAACIGLWKFEALVDTTFQEGLKDIAKAAAAERPQMQQRLDAVLTRFIGAFRDDQAAQGCDAYLEIVACDNGHEVVAQCPNPNGDCPRIRQL